MSLHFSKQSLCLPNTILCLSYPILSCFDSVSILCYVYPVLLYTILSCPIAILDRLSLSGFSFLHLLQLLFLTSFQFLFLMLLLSTSIYFLFLFLLLCPFTCPVVAFRTMCTTHRTTHRKFSYVKLPITTYPHTRMNKYLYTKTKTYMNTHVHTCMHTCIHTYPSIYILTHADARTQTDN